MQSKSKVIDDDKGNDPDAEVPYRLIWLGVLAMTQVIFEMFLQPNKILIITKP
jgi:hypothetical protein